MSSEDYLYEGRFILPSLLIYHFKEERIMKFVSKLTKLFKRIFNRTVICIIGILIQLCYLIGIFWSFGTYFTYSYVIFEAGAIAIAFSVINSDKHPSYKLTWILPILIVPILGVMLYVCFGSGNSANRLRKRMDQFNEEERLLLTQNSGIIDFLSGSSRKEIKDISKQANYLYNYGGYPVYINSNVTYFESGEAKFEVLCRELEKAKRFIFLEYFIIEEGKMWHTILKILEQKVSEGVDVRVVYDDLGCLRTLPYKYYDYLEKKGIKCKAFNKFHPFWVARMNNRDHRKILVIDGHTAFNGGVNLADEYINFIVKYGHWKDSAVMIKGEAVWSFTVMFLTMWNYLENVKPQSYDCFMPKEEEIIRYRGSPGLVIPYTDSPLDKESVGENLYISIINNATEYVYITTPYLIITNEMEAALSLAAKSGIDVRIITPHVPDKWYVLAVTRSYYKQLTKNGVKIYEYTPGFIHAKNFVSDDKVGVVGTINLDYRSLYLHFECGTYMYKTDCLLDVKADFLKTIEKCQEVTYDDTLKTNPLRRLGRSILKLFAPLM